MFIRNVFFSALFTLMIIAQMICSAQPVVTRELEVTLRGVKTTYDITNGPVTLKYQVGDTLLVYAKISAPGSFTGFTGWLTGTTNPQTKVVTGPASLTVGATVALSYEMSLVNSEFVDNRTFEFDVLIRTMAGSFVLTAYQCTFDLNTAVLGTLTMSYVSGSSQLSNVPNTGFQIVGREPGFAVGGPGIDTITITAKKIGRFRLVSTENFPYNTMNLTWDFDGSHNTIITGENITDVTSFGTFVNLPERHFVKIIVN